MRLQHVLDSLVLTEWKKNQNIYYLTSPTVICMFYTSYPPLSGWVLYIRVKFCKFKKQNFAGKFKHISIVFKSFSSFLLTMLAIHVACFISVKLLYLVSFYSNRLVTCMININTFV